MLAIRFDGRYFTTLAGLADYLVSQYGGFWGVPKSHPGIVVVNSLATLNPLWFTGGEHAGELDRVSDEVAQAIDEVLGPEE